jgi:hypothetical protein
VPDRPLPPGRYALERVLPYIGDDQRWYVVDELDVVEIAEPVAQAPQVDWDRRHVSSSCGPASLIRAQVPPIPGARWLDVEISGRGVVATFPAIDEGSFVYISDDACTHRKITLPPDEAIEIRAVAVGLDGARVPGAWSMLDAVGPVHPSRGLVPRLRRVEVPVAMIFEEADGCWNVVEPQRRGR